MKNANFINVTPENALEHAFFVSETLKLLNLN
jgi:hypothetical protein